jgi:hypothetical protein
MEHWVFYHCALQRNLIVCAVHNLLVCMWFLQKISDTSFPFPLYTVQKWQLTNQDYNLIEKTLDLWRYLGPEIGEDLINSIMQDDLFPKLGTFSPGSWMINLKQTFDTIQRSYADFFPFKLGPELRKCKAIQSTLPCQSLRFARKSLTRSSYGSYQVLLGWGTCSWR